MTLAWHRCCHVAATSRFIAKTIRADIYTKAPQPRPRNARTHYSERHRNRELAKALKDAASTRKAYDCIKKAARSLLAGHCSAQNFVSKFRSVYPDKGVADLLLVKFSVLVPSIDLRTQLMQASSLDLAVDQSTGLTKIAKGEHGSICDIDNPPRTASRKTKRRNRGDAGRGIHLSGSSRPTGGSVVYWIRQDFRLHDNPALQFAVKMARKASFEARVACVYIHSPGEEGDDCFTGEQWYPGSASRLWLHYSLLAMDQDLRAQYGEGARIIFANGPFAETLEQIAKSFDASLVVANKRYEPRMVRVDDSVTRQLQNSGMEVHLFNALLLFEPTSVTIDMSRWKGHFGTLMPFYAACARQGGGHIEQKQLLSSPKGKFPGASKSISPLSCEVSLSEFGLYTPAQRRDGTLVDWGASIREAWQINESAALGQLRKFIDVGLSRYESERGQAAAHVVSRLSPYLHFGQLSPRYMMRELEKHNGQAMSKTFWRRLVWRDLAYWQLHHWPHMATKSIRPAYQQQEWANSSWMLRAWQQGTTGFPMVDAGMRELWHSGYMHQNVRMLVACFLTEYLHIHWVHGARWFHDTLVDADLAINSMMWQNAGKSGLDQWNFTVRPDSKAADPKGDYIRRWVPELGKLNTEYIHAPWTAPRDALLQAGVKLGMSYPERIVVEELQQLRQRHLDAIQAVRSQHPQTLDDSGYDIIVIPSGSASGVVGKMIRLFTVRELRAHPLSLSSV